MANDALKAAPSVEAKSPLIPAPEKNWNESQWFWWTDKERGFTGLHRIAHQPNAGTAHIWNILIADDGRYTRRTSHTIAYADWMREGGVYSVEGLSFQHISIQLYGGGINQGRWWSYDWIVLTSLVKRPRFSNVDIHVDDDNGVATSQSYITLLQQTDDFPLQVILSGTYCDDF